MAMGRGSLEENAGKGQKGKFAEEQACEGRRFGMRD
jgi:hypothetical protein